MKILKSKLFWFGTPWAISFVLLWLDLSFAQATQEAEHQDASVASTTDIAVDRAFKLALAKELSMDALVFPIESPAENVVSREQIRSKQLGKLHEILPQVLREGFFEDEKTLDNLEYYRITPPGLKHRYDVLGVELEWDMARILVTYSPGARLRIRVRVPDEMRIPAMRRGTESDARLLEMLQEILRVPYSTTNELRIQGHTKDVAGVKLFSGTVQREGADATKLLLEGKFEEVKWYDEIHVSVFYSAPQYAVFHISVWDPDSKRWARRPKLFLDE